MLETHQSAYLPMPYVPFFLGFSTFLPVGSTYLALIVLLPLTMIRFKESWRQVDRLWLIALALLLIWPLTSLALNHNDQFADRYLDLIRLAISLIIALLLNGDERRLLLSGFLWGSAVAIAVVLTHHLLRPLPDWIVWRNLLTVRGNGSSQKWIMLAIVPSIALTLALGEKTARARWLLAVLAIGAIVAVLSFSISRNSFLVAALSPFFAVAYTYRSKKACLGGLALILVFAVAALTISEPVHDRFERASHELRSFFAAGRFDSSVGVRAMMYQVALQFMREHWFFGTGLGSWQEIWLGQSTAYPKTAGLNNPHGDFFLWGMETGALGLLSLVLICFLPMKASWANKNPIAASGWLMIWCLVMAALVNAPFRDAALGMSLTVLAVALSQHRSVESSIVK